MRGIATENEFCAWLAMKNCEYERAARPRLHHDINHTKHKQWHGANVKPHVQMRNA